MKYFEYSDEEIGRKEILFAVPTMVIGLGIITLPRRLAETTQASDGWISILLGGLIAVFFVWLAAKLASKFPKQSFLEYTARIVSKPIAMILSFIFAVHLLAFTGFIVRSVSNISNIYLFDRTPIEAIALAFLLVVIYGVSGSRAGLLRLNILFFPITLVILCFIIFTNFAQVEFNNLKPHFTTNWSGYLKGVQESIFSYLGFGIVLFYISNMNRPQTAPKAAAIGMIVPILLYIFVYFVVIGVFGQQSTLQIVDPLIEMAKESQVPGQFLERTESLFFVIWIMTLFNTTVMAFDTAVMALKSIFTKIKKMKLIIILSPLIFLWSMVPSNIYEVFYVGQWISYMEIIMAMILPAALLLIAKVRRI